MARLWYTLAFRHSDHVCLVLDDSLDVRLPYQRNFHHGGALSDLLRGRIDLFSTDTLIDMLARLGIGVRLVVKVPRSRRVA